MGLYQALKQTWRTQGDAMNSERMIEWRAGRAFTVVDKPLRLDRARALGYKAKKGFVVVRVRLIRGGRKRERAGVKGRKSRKQYARKILKMSYRWISEIRAERHFPNLQVLNSYPIGEDGKHAFFEVIMVDPHRPEIQSDRTMRWVCEPKNWGRAQRGITSAAHKSRGLRTKSHTMKVRPSGRSWNRKGK